MVKKKEPFKMTNKTFAQFGFKMSHSELLKIGTSLAQDEEFLPKHMSALSLVYIFHHSYLFGDIFQSYTQDGPGHIRTPSIFQAALLPYWLMGIKKSSCWKELWKGLAWTETNSSNNQMILADAAKDSTHYSVAPIIKWRDIDCIILRRQE